MKKILLVLVVLVIIAIIGMGMGLGLGKGNGTGEGNSGVETNQQEVESEENKDTEQSSQEADDVSETVIVEITVMENDYFYKNERISLEDFVKAIQEIQEDMIVEVKDDNASLKVYNKLLDKLEELGVAVSEQ